MTTRPSHHQLTEWSEAVARDPASLLFLPLAKEYRDRGLTDAAIRICIRGLERRPSHVEAHHLLGTLYHDAGDLTRAFDEWDIVLRLDPSHLAARHLLESLPAAETRRRNLRRDSRGSGGPREQSPAGAGGADTRPFAAMSSLDGIRGAIVLDRAGTVLGGELRLGGVDHAPEVAAALGGLADEVARATEYLGLGSWRELALEAGPHTLVAAPAGGAIVAVLGDAGVPLGWLTRISKQMRDAAGKWLAVRAIPPLNE